MKKTPLVFWSLFGLSFCIAQGQAEEVTFFPSDDTAISGWDIQHDLNGGKSPELACGGRGSGADFSPMRILIRFDIASEIPAGSTITGAEIRLFMAVVPSDPPNDRQGGSTFGFHQMLVPWIEGSALAGRPGVGPWEAGNDGNGEPTWNNRAHPNTPWGAPGGLPGTDFEEIPAVTRPFFRGNQPEVFVNFSFGAAGLAEIQEMLDTPSSNFGWMLKSDGENTSKTARLFSSKDELPPGNPEFVARRPIITITFDPPSPAPPEDFTLLFPSSTTRSLSFSREPNTAYMVEFSTALASDTWSLLQNIPASAVGGQTTIPVPSPFPNRQFFRISAQ